MYKPEMNRVYNILENINNYGMATASQLYRKGIYSYPAIYKVLKYLIVRGMITSTPKDGRSINYSLTQYGVRVLAALKIIREEWYRMM